jgi:Uma2 family endonuclease
MAILTKRKPKSHAPKLMTTQEFLALPPDENCETALIYGRMIVMPRPRPKHNRSILFLGSVLHNWVSSLKSGLVFIDNDLILDAENALVYAPDLIFVSKENEEQYRDEMIFAPVDLCVEILSPSERPSLQLRKYRDYEKHGIRWFWVIDQNSDEPTLTEYQLVNGLYECRAEIVGDQWFEPGLFPGLTFRLPQLLAGDLKGAVKGKAKRLM